MFTKTLHKLLLNSSPDRRQMVATSRQISKCRPYLAPQVVLVGKIGLFEFDALDLKGWVSRSPL